MTEETTVGKDEFFWDFKGAVDYLDEWPLMGTPYTALLILVSYLFFVLRCGPKLMKDRPPFKLRRIIILYNVLQVALSLYIFNIGTEIMFEIGISESTCVMDDKGYKDRIVRGFYIYFLAKLSELFDTIFFVLRKKWIQVSFLHVYHHFIMCFCVWICVKYEPNYSFVFLGTINSFVHVVMYSYYALSAFPRLKKYLWWKKYITKLQLIQFLLIFIQVTWNYFVTPCPPSHFLLVDLWIHLFLFIYLFTDFYLKSYQKKTKDEKVCDATSRNGVEQKVLDKNR